MKKLLVLLSIWGTNAHALSADADTAITAAYTSGGTSVGLVVVGIIALMALIVGVGLIVGFMGKK